MPSLVNNNRPSLSLSSRPAGYTLATGMKCFNKLSLGSPLNWQRVLKGLLNKSTRGVAGRGRRGLVFHAADLLLAKALGLALALGLGRGERVVGLRFTAVALPVVGFLFTNYSFG